jgi:hypothetical protein
MRGTKGVAERGGEVQGMGNLNRMESDAWIAFTCRGCREAVKISRGMAGKQVICPRCRTKVTAPFESQPVALAKLAKEEGGVVPTRLPAVRQDMGGFQDLGRVRDEWERGAKPVGGAMDFVPGGGGKRERGGMGELPEAVEDGGEEDGAEEGDEEDDAVGEVEDVGVVDAARVARYREAGVASGKSKGKRRRRKVRKVRKGRDGREGFDEAAGGTGRRRRRRGGVPPGFVFLMWAGMAGLAVAAGWAAVKSLRSAPVVARAVVPAAEERSPTELTEMFVEASRAFLTAPDGESALKLVREPERVGAAFRAWYGPENPWKPLELADEALAEGDLQLLGKIAAGKLPLKSFETVLMAGELKEGRYLIDWESFSGWGERTWDGFMTERPKVPVLMRVVVKLGPTTDYFGQDFTDSEAYQCYQLSDAAADHVLSGYVVKNGSVDAALQQALIVPGERSRKALVCHAVVR